MYRQIETGTWDDPEVAKLPTEAKLLFIYLFSNRYGHLSGIYHLPDVTILHELGAKKDKIGRFALDTLWNTLSGAELAWRDSKMQMVFIKSMFKYQGQGEKHYQSAALHIKTLHKTGLINRFVDVYPRIKNFGISSIDDRVPDRVSVPKPINPSGTGTGTEAETGKEKSISSESLSAESVPSQPCDCKDEFEIFTEMPCKGKEKIFPITKLYIREMKALYPGIDVEAETLRAKGWLLNNPTRGKTHRGMRAYLGNWYSRTQDQGGKANGKDRKGNRGNFGFMGEPEFNPE